MLDPYESAQIIAKKIKDGLVSSYEVVQASIERIEIFDKQINCVVVRDFEEALLKARQADLKQSKSNTLGPLHGVPMTIKEAFDIAGHPTTWGVSKFKKNVAKRDSLIVEKLKNAGAIFLGKTNVPEMLSDWQSFNKIYGTTNNPWDHKRSPGGSSGGSAAALAAGFISLEIGSDIGGSIRGPSHYCGVYGHKPSFGIVPMDGHSIPNLEIDLDLLVAGPLARTAGDLRLTLNTIKGPTRQNSEAWNIKLPETKYHSLSNLKVAICIDQKMCKLDQEIIEKLTKIANFLEGIGATVSFDSMPAFDLEEVHDLYLKNLRGTTGALMNDIDYSLANKEAINIKPEDKSYFAYVTRSAIQTHRDFFNIEQKRQIIRNEWAKFFENWDILLCPNTASTAMYHDQELPRHQRTILINGKKESYNDQLFWPGLAVYSYLPSTSFPAGLAKNGLPIGIQAIGPYLHDLDTINFAEMMEVTYGGFKKPPNY